MSKDRKIIVLIRNAQPYDFGGGERFPTFVADVLKSIDHPPVIISGSKSVIGFAKSHGIATIKGLWWRNQDWSGARALLFPVYILWQLFLTLYYLAIFIRIHPLAVHIQSKDDFIAGTFAAKLTGTKVVWTDHADLKHIWLNLRVWYKNPVGKFVYLAANIVDTIVVVSKNEARLITANIPQRSFVWSKLQLIHNGCSDTYNSTPRIQQPVFTFCIANRLVTDKGIGETITAFKKIYSEFPDTQLLLLGDGPEGEVFKKQAGISEGIRFMGHQDDPYSIMASSDVFLQPTYHDAFSVVIVEASMLGLAIIATSIGGNIEIIFDENTGLLVPSKDADALYTAMRRLRTDASLRKKLSSNARDNYLKDFVFDDIISKQYIPLYKGGKPSGLTKELIA